VRGRWHHHHHGDPRQREEWRRHWIRTPRVRRLQARLFFWFLAAILAAFGAAMLSAWAMRSADGPPAPIVATRGIANHLAHDWDDPQACDAYIARVHDLIGLDVRLRRDVDSLPHRMGLKGGAVTFGAHGEGFIPVVREGELVGAVQFDAGTAVTPHVNGVVAIGAALFVLAMAARGVARRLAWPLEDVADAAERFGGGDLTARTRLGKRRRWVADEVRGVAQAFDQMADRIARVVRDQRELLAAISHELRSPLGRARVALEIARERGGEGASASLADIERQLTDVDAILGDLLAAARAGLSDVKPVATPIVAWLRARIAAETTPPEIELTCEVRDDVTVQFDAQLLNRALHNILANARAHGHPIDRPIEVSLDVDDTRVRIVARDHGPGFPPELLPRVFEPFVKGDAARTPGAGYGLGLALLRRIAEAHGGRAFASNVASGEAGETRETIAVGEAPDGAGAKGETGAQVGFELPRVRREV
jgi:two-component system OmpR family sensor kinase